MNFLNFSKFENHEIAIFSNFGPIFGYVLDAKLTLLSYVEIFCGSDDHDIGNCYLKLLQAMIFQTH